MGKRNKTFFEIFLQGVGLYFSNATKFIHYMSFSVFGQLFALIIIYYSVVLYNKNITTLTMNFPILNDVLYKHIILSLVILPGAIFYLITLWKYWVAYGSINSMTDTLLKSDRLYDYPAHDMLITNNWLTFLCIALMYHLLILLTTIPIFWIIGIILLIYFSLIFQIFIFEGNMSIMDYFKKSSVYVHAHFKNMFGLILCVGTLTYCILPQLICSLLDFLKIKNFFVSLVADGIQISSLYGINLFLDVINHPPITPEKIGQYIVTTTIFILTIQILLPLRTICLCLWYKIYCNDNDVVKKVDEKFMARINKEVKRRKRNQE